MAPLLITLMIILVIWYIYPAYTDGSGGIKEQRVELERERGKLAVLGKKIENSQKLSTQIIKDEESRNILFTYLPEKNKEEEIIDNLNFLASSEEGLSVQEISVAQPEKKSVAVSSPSESALPDSAPGMEAAGMPGMGMEAVQAKPEAEYFTVSLAVAGEYGKIKSFLDKVYRLKRFNRVLSLDIGKPQESGEETSVSPDALEAGAVLEFSVYGKEKQAVDAENKIFSEGVFTMNIIQKVKDRTNTDMLKLNAEQQGKGNPFLP